MGCRREPEQIKTARRTGRDSPSLSRSAGPHGDGGGGGADGHRARVEWEVLVLGAPLLDSSGGLY